MIDHTTVGDCDSCDELSYNLGLYGKTWLCPDCAEDAKESAGYYDDLDEEDDVL